MKTITYEGEGLAITMELGQPTIKTGVLEALAVEYLRTEAPTNIALGQVALFGSMLKYTRRVTGLPFELPRWNATKDEMSSAFQAFLDLPEAFGDLWYQEVEALKNVVPLPLTQSALPNTNDMPVKTPALSTGKGKRSGSVRMNKLP